MATDSSTLLPTDAPVENPLGTYLTYPEWKQSNSTPVTSTDEDLPKYLDYYRLEALKRGELTQRKESEIQDYYVDWYTNGQNVSDEEYAKIANMSTGYVSGTNQEAALVSRVFPFIDWADLDAAKQNDYLNRSKRALLHAGELPYATLVEGGMGVVHAGNYGTQGLSNDRKNESGNQALEAYHAGAIDPRDLWQVAEGLTDSGIPNKTKFQAAIDKRDLEVLQALMLNPESESATKISDAIGKTIDLETYRKEGSWWNQIFADRPEEITQIISKDLPPEIAEIQPLLMAEIAKSEGWGDVQMSGLDPDNAYRFTNERLFSLIRELAISHANNQGVFKFDPDNNENNIRITPLGLPIAHPELMKRGDFNSIIAQDKRLSPAQRSALKLSRSNFIVNMHLPAMDDIWAKDHLDSVVGDRWATYKTENPNGFREDPEAFYDNFVNNKDNYDQSKNWWGGVKASVPNAIVGIGASLGAMLGDKQSAEYLANHQKKEAGRRQTASVFGEDLGFGYDLSTLAPQVVADIGATMLVGGVLTKAGKLSKIGAIDDTVASVGTVQAKTIVGAKTQQILNKTSGSKAKKMARQRVKDLIEQSPADSTKTRAAINAYNDLVARELGIRSGIFLTSTNRSAGGMYATVYNSLPEDMPHEEKHDKALGPALLAGTTTGLITTGFSALNMGGAEDIISKRVTYNQFKNSLNSLGGASWINDSTTKALLKKPLKEKITSLISSEGAGIVGTTLRGALYEGVEEGIDEFVNSFIETSATNQFMPMADRINQSLYALSLGGVMGGTITLGSNALYGLGRLRSLAESKSFDPQKEAEDIAFENAAVALQESGLDISAEQLRSLRTAQVEADKVEQAEAEAAVIEPEEQESEQQESEVQESEDKKPEATPSVFSPDFSGTAVSPELIKKYIQGWSPSVDNVPDVYLDFNSIDNTRVPMQVGIFNKDVTDPTVTWQIDATSLAEELTGLPVEQRKRTLDSYIGHELIHVSEFNYLKDLWKNANRPGAFVDFARNYLTERYQRLAESKGGRENLAQVVATHLGIDVDQVDLPMLDANVEPSMQPDEIVSELTRQLIQLSSTPLSKGLVPKGSDSIAEQYKDLPNEYLEWLQNVVGHARQYLDPKVKVVPTENKGLYEPATELYRNHLDKVENFYVSILSNSLQGKMLNFAAEDIEALQQETIPDPTPEPDPVEPKYDAPWKAQTDAYLEAGKMGKKDDPVDVDPVDVEGDPVDPEENALREIYKIHLLANPELGFTEASVNSLVEYYQQVETKFKDKEDEAVSPPSTLEDLQYITGIGVLKSGDTKIPTEVYNEIKPAILKASELGNKTASSYLESFHNTFSDVDVKKVAPSNAYNVVSNVAPSLGKLETVVSEIEGSADTLELSKRMNSVATNALEEAPDGLVVEYNYNSKSFHHPINVSEGKVNVNVYGLPKLLENQTDDKAIKILKEQVAIKSKEDEFLRSLPIDQITGAAEEINNNVLSFLSVESNKSLASTIKTEENIQEDPELAKEIISNFIKKYSSEALEDSYNLKNTFTLLNAYPKLRALAVRSLEFTLDKSKDSTLRRKLTKAKSHLNNSKFTEANVKNVQINNADIPNSIELIRTVISENTAPEADVDTTPSDLEIRLEIPLGEANPYQAPKPPPSWAKNKGWVNKLWSFLAGNIDPRWKREQERRINFMERTKAEVEMIINDINAEVKKLGGWNTPNLATLMQTASGKTDGNEVSDEFEAEQIRIRDAEVDAAKENLSNDAAALYEATKQANKDLRSRIDEEKQRVSEENKRVVKAALASLTELSPKLGDLIRYSRDRINEASKLIAKKLEASGLEGFTDINLRFSAQEGFYLTRSFRIFKDPKYAKAIKEGDTKEFEGIDLVKLRVNAGKAMIADKRRKEIARAIAEKDKQAVQDNDLSWLRMSEFSKKELVEEEQIKNGRAWFTQANDQEFERAFLDLIANYGEEDTDILQRKKKIPKAVRQAMGEIELPNYNIVQTLANVNSFANAIAEGENLLMLGRQGEGNEDVDRNNWWFFTTKEFNEIISKEGQESDPELYEKVRNFVPIIDEEGKAKLPPSLNSTYNKLASDSDEHSYYMDPGVAEYLNSVAGKRVYNLSEDLASSLNKILRQGVGYSLGVNTLTSVSYYTRNITGNVTYFPLSQGMLPFVGAGFLGKDLGKELMRAVKKPTLDEAVLAFLEKGVTEPEFTSSMMNDLLDGEMTRQSVEGQIDSIFSELQEANGLEKITEDNDTALIKTLRKAKSKKGLVTPRNVMRKLQRLSIATDSWYKIGYYLHELKHLKKSRQWEIDNNVDEGLASLSDQQIDAMAVDTVKRTTQFYSQSVPLVDAFTRSSAGVLFSPYVRFRFETLRIMVNTIKKATQELRSKNPVIKARGAKRMSGAMSVGIVTSAGSLISEPILVALTAVLGHQVADDLDDEMRDALQLSVPSYLRDHTFLYTKKDGKYYSWDLTYLNPYAMWLDAFPTAARMMRQGHAPHEAMIYAGSRFFALPFVEGQIATQSFFNMMQNRDAKGDPIWFENDDPVTKATKGLTNFALEAYGPPAGKVLSKKVLAEAQAGEFNLGRAIRDLASPLKPYEVDPVVSFSSFAREANRDRLMNRKQLNRQVSDRPLSESELRSIARDNINISLRLAKRFRRYAPAFRRLGVPAKIIKERGESLFPSGRFQELGAGRFSPEELTPGMFKLLTQPGEMREVKIEQNKKIREMQKELMPKGRSFLDD